jgi:hypothetical protein
MAVILFGNEVVVICRREFVLLFGLTTFDTVMEAFEIHLRSLQSWTGHSVLPRRHEGGKALFGAGCSKNVARSVSEKGREDVSRMS